LIQRGFCELWPLAIVLPIAILTALALPEPRGLAKRRNPRSRKWLPRRKDLPLRRRAADHLRWQDVDLFNRVATIRRSNCSRPSDDSSKRRCDGGVGLTARSVAQALGSREPEHYVFPLARCGLLIPCVRRKLAHGMARACRRDSQARRARGAQASTSIRAAIAAWKRATAPISGLRFTTFATRQSRDGRTPPQSDATLMAVAGHVSRRMLEHSKPRAHGGQAHCWKNWKVL